MFINPRTAIKEGWVRFPEWMTPSQQEKCIQPNALDFTIDKISTISGNTACIIGEEIKLMRNQFPLDQHDGALRWSLDKGSYDFTSDFYVDLPEGVAVMVIARSTFVRNGMFITTGLWDSGFKGHAGGVIHNMIGVSYIEQHVRVGQLIFVQSDASGIYTGGYNTSVGQHWTSTLPTTLNKPN